MSKNQKDAVKIFDDKKVRSVWDAEAEKWYISIVDVIEILTDSPNPRKYWSVLKTRLKKEGSRLATNCSQLKLQSSDGKKYLTDVADVNCLYFSAFDDRESHRRPIRHELDRFVDFGKTR